MFIRAIGDRQLEGIIIPFNVRDKYNTWWDENSDVMLRTFQSRPVFWWHLDAKRADDHQWQRAGVVLDDSYEVRPAGIYARVQLDTNGVADLMYRRALQNDLAWSTGAMPNLVTIEESGYVSRWGFVELSGAPADSVVSQRGTTTAQIPVTVRSILSDMGINDANTIERGEWMTTPAVSASNGAHDDTKENVKVQPAQDLSEILATLRSMNKEIGELRTQINTEPPAKSVDKVVDPAPAAPKIEVAYKYDELSLFASALRLRAFPETQKDTQYVRSVVEKMRVAREATDAQRQTDLIIPDGDRMALRSLPVDDAAYKAWTARVPHLRANEAMVVDSNLVDTLLESVAWYTFRMNTRVLQTLPSFVMSEPNVTRTVIGTGPTVRLVSELTDQNQATVSNSPIPSSKITTSQVTWATKKVGALTIASEEVFEESSVNMLEVWAQQYARSFADGMDDMLLNGDERETIANISYFHTTGSDTLVGTTSDRLLALDGLRREAIDNTYVYDFGSGGDSVNTDGTIDSKDMTRLRRQLGTRGALGTDLSNIVAFCDLDAYYLLSELDDYKSASDVNNLSTLLNGTLDVVRGVPLIPTSQIALTTTEGKVHQATGNTKASMLIVHRPSFIVGMFRSLMTEVTRIPHSESRAISATVRMDMQNWQDTAVSYGINITP